MGKAVGYGAVVLLTLGLGCNIEPPLCDICTTSAIVYGTVRDTAGAPIAGAIITVNAWRDSCTAAPALGRTNVSPKSDSAGTYRDAPYSGLAPFQACLRVSVHAPPGALWRDTSVTGATVRFRADQPPGPHDSVQVDVVVRY